MARKTREDVMVERAQRKVKTRYSTGLRSLIATILTMLIVAGVWYAIYRATRSNWLYTLREVVERDVNTTETRALQDDGFMHVRNDHFGVSYHYSAQWNLDTDTYAVDSDKDAIYRIQIRQENSAPRFQMFAYFARNDKQVSSDELMVMLAGYFDGLNVTFGEEGNDIGMVAGYPAVAYAFQSENNNGCLLTVTGNEWSLMSILLSPPLESETALTSWTQFLSSLEVQE